MRLKKALQRFVTFSLAERNFDNCLVGNEYRQELSILNAGDVPNSISFHIDDCQQAH